MSTPLPPNTTETYPAGSAMPAGHDDVERHPEPGAAALGDVGDVSVGDLIGNVTRDLSTLMRQELALAQAELKQEATKTGKAAGALAGAGFAAFFVVLFLSIALWAGLSNVMDAGWAGLDRRRAVGRDRRGPVRDRTQEAPRGQPQAGAHGRHPQPRTRRPQGPARRHRVTTPSDPDQIRREIERTQANLSTDVDALTEKVSPGRIVERRVNRVRGTATDGRRR